MSRLKADMRRVKRRVQEALPVSPLAAGGKGGVVIRLRARNAVNMTDLGTTAGIQVSDE